MAKPILFSTEDVRVILDVRKTVTRRAIKPQPKPSDGEISWCPISTNPRHVGKWLSEDGERIWKPPYQPEDIMYVREPFYKDINRFMYKANYSEKEKFFRDGNEVSIKWQPSARMPKEAARIWLRVTDVKVERLRPMGLDELEAEGINISAGMFSATARFADMWDSTIKKSDLGRYGWEANPYVWRIVFERCEKPESEGNDV